MRIILFFLLVLPFQAFAQIYQCKINGKTVFSDRPCAADAKVIQVKMDTQVGSFGYEGLKQANQLIGRDNRNRDIIRDIRRIEDKIDGYNANLSYELQLLKQKKRRANNNLAGATWEESISQEMQAVTSKYRLKIDEARLQMSELKEEQKELGF